VMFVHHWSADSLFAHWSGWRFARPVHPDTEAHTRLVYRQEKTRWCAVSIVARRRGQEGLWSQSFRASLSEVQTLFWRMSHAKNLHFGGAQDFQIVESSCDLMQSTNCGL
jgi:hypothetical protein